MKKTAVFLLAMVTVFTMAQASFAADIVEPQNHIYDSEFGNANVLTTVIDEHFGSGETQLDDVIIPVNIISGIRANVLNVIQTVVNVDINIDGDSIADMVKDLRSSAINNYTK